MPRVLIVEDEPAAGRYLRSMIELKRPDFSVVGIAENGQAALEEIRLHMPDLVITDVRMPVMDGIEFVAELKKEFPSLPAVIVSGYQEFEYARRALDTGVVDYLLKPVDPIRLAEVLDRLSAQISAREDERRAVQLARLVAGDEPATVGHVAREERFKLAVARVGGLPSRFHLDPRTSAPSARSGDFYSLPGRDSRERIVLGLAASTCSIADAALASIDKRGPFVTVFVAGAPVGLTGLHEAAREACLGLDRSIVVGKTQVCYSHASKPAGPDWDKALADRIDYALRESRLDLLEKAVRGMAEGWGQAGISLISVESRLRQVLHFVLRKAPRADAAFGSGLELHLEEALAEVQGPVDIADAAWSLVGAAAGSGVVSFRGSDVPALFECIVRYVEARYADELTLGSLSDAFRISPSYLSKLFRKHAGGSFGEQLSAVRIDAAKRLIGENPGMPLKDIAERVGFRDPFYFSRVFKSQVGVPPSDFGRSGDRDISQGHRSPDD